MKENNKNTKPIPKKNKKSSTPAANKTKKTPAPVVKKNKTDSTVVAKKDKKDSTVVLEKGQKDSISLVKKNTTKVVNMIKKNKTSLFVILGIVAVIGFATLIGHVTAPEDAKEVNFKDIAYSEYEKLFDENVKGLTFIYLGNERCDFCVEIVPLLGKLQEEEEIDFHYLDTYTMVEEDFESLSKTATAFQGDWGTPTLVAIVDGKEHSFVGGLKPLDELREFVKEAKEAVK